MLKKVICFVCFLIMALALPGNAIVQNDYEAMNKAQQVNLIANYDFSNLFNKSELIGYNLTNYSIATSQYKQFAMSTFQRIQSLLSQIRLVKGNIDLTDEEKTMQINRMYQDIDAALYSLDSQTLTYIYSLRTVMPTITYQRFVKKFEEYYNSLNLTPNKITLE